MSQSENKSLEQLSEEQKELFEVLNNESEVACVLIGTSFLDECLRQLLKKYFIKNSSTVDKLLNNDGPIGTFSNRYRLAYSIGLISKPLLKDLIKISQIRNIFAHSHLKTAFSSETITGKIEELKYIDLLDEEIELKNGSQSEELKFSHQIQNVRDKFSLTISIISMQLILIAMDTNHKSVSKAYLKNILDNKS